MPRSPLKSKHHMKPECVKCHLMKESRTQYNAKRAGTGPAGRESSVGSHLERKLGTHFRNGDRTIIIWNAATIHKLSTLWYSRVDRRNSQYYSVPCSQN